MTATTIRKAISVLTITLCLVLSPGASDATAQKKGKKMGSKAQTQKRISKGSRKSSPARKFNTPQMNQKKSNQINKNGKPFESRPATNRQPKVQPTGYNMSPWKNSPITRARLGNNSQARMNNHHADASNGDNEQTGRTQLRRRQSLSNGVDGGWDIQSGGMAMRTRGPDGSNVRATGVNRACGNQLGTATIHFANEVPAAPNGNNSGILPTDRSENRFKANPGSAIWQANYGASMTVQSGHKAKENFDRSNAGFRSHGLGSLNGVIEKVEFAPRKRSMIGDAPSKQSPPTTSRNTSADGAYLLPPTYNQELSDAYNSFGFPPPNANGFTLNWREPHEPIPDHSSSDVQPGNSVRQVDRASSELAGQTTNSNGGNSLFTFPDTWPNSTADRNDVVKQLRPSNESGNSQVLTNNEILRRSPNNIKHQSNAPDSTVVFNEMMFRQGESTANTPTKKK